MNDFLLMLQAMLDKTKSLLNIKNDIKIIESKLPKIKIQGTLDSKTKKELSNKLNNTTVKVKVDADTKQAESKIKKLLQTRKQIKITPSVDNSQLTSDLKTTGKTAQSFFEKFTNNIAGLNILRIAFYKIAQAASKAVESVKDLDTIKTNIQMAAQVSNSEIDSMMKTYNQMGKELSSTTAKVAETADEFIRMGESVSSTNELIKNAQMLSVLGKIDNSDAASYIISGMKGYQIAAQDSIKIVDKLTAADMEAAISSGGLAEALSKTSNIANSSGVSLDRLIGYLSVVGETTQKSMSEVGNSFQAIFSRMNNIKINRFIDDETGESLSDTEAVLNKLGIKLRDTEDTYRDFDDVLDDVGKKWNLFTQKEQNAISVAVAGTRQRENFVALMNNYGNALKYTEVSANSAGTAMNRYEQYQDSIDAKTNELISSLESLSMNTISEDLYKGVLKATTGIIEFVDKTNLLKGSLAGLATYGISKAFVSMSAGIISAAKSTAQLTSVMAMFNNVRSAENLKSIGAACNGLTDKQMKLVLSTTGLTNSQRLMILQGNGIEESQRQQMLTTLGFSQAENTATASTFSFAGALNTLKAAFAANPIGMAIMAVTTAVSIGTMAYSSYKQSAEEAEQAISDATNRIEKLSDTLKSNQQTVSDSAKRFAELAQGIDTLTGKNVSLSDENYKEFLSISNDLAEVFPTLSRNYDENGNAIVQLSGNVDTIVGSLQDLIEAQRDLTNSQIAEELPTVFKSASVKSDAYKAELDSLEQQRDALVKSLGNVQSNDFADKFIDGISKKWLTVSSDNLEVLSQMKNDYEKLLKEANIDFETLTPNFKTNEYGQEVPVDFTFNITSSDEDIEKAKKTIDSGVQALAVQYEKDITQLNTDIANTNSKNKSNWSSLGESIAAWLNTDSSYKVMSDSMQSSVQQIINNLDWSTLDFSSWDDAKQYVQDNIIGLFEGVDGSKIAKQFEKAFDLKTQFQNGEVTLDEYLKGISDFKSLIDGFDDNTKKSVDFIFTVSSPEGSSVDAMIQGVEDKLQDSAIEKVGELSLGDLEIAFDKIDVPQGTLLSWEELLDLINKYKESVKAAPDFSSTFSDLPIDKVEEYVSMLNSGTITEKNISSFSDLNDIMSKTGTSAEDAVKSIKDYADGFTLSTDLTSNLQDAYDLLQDVGKQYDKTKVIGLSSLESIVNKYPLLRSAVNEYTQGLIGAEDVLAQLKKAYDNDAIAYKSSMAYRMSANEKFFSEIKNNNQGLFNSLNTAYGLDVKNWKTMAQAKAEIDQTLIRNLSTAWSKYYNIIVDSASGLASFAGQDIGHGSSHGVAMPEEQQKAWSAATEQVNKYNQLINKLNEAANIQVDTSDFNGIGSAGSDSSSKDKATKDFSKIFDWAAVDIDKVDEKFEKLQDKISDASNWKVKNTLTDTAIDAMSNKLSALQLQADTYQKQADSYDVSPVYLDKIKNGTLEIETITDEVIANNIESYQEWYNKAEDVRKQIDETKKSMKELAKSRLDNIINDFDSLTSLSEKYASYSEKLISLQKDLGEEITNTDFEQLINQQRGIYDELQGKYESLSAELSKAVSKDTIQVGDEAWRKYNGELVDVNNSMLDIVSSMNDFRKSMIELPFEELNQFTNSVNLANTEISAMIELLGDEGLTDNGMITSKGLTKIALIGQEYANAKQQAANYAEAIDAVNEMYSNGSLTQAEYNDKINEYTSAQLSAVNATKQAEDAIIQFRKNAIQEQITNMNDLTTAKKDALEAEKEYQDYLNDVNKKQTDINNLQAKIDELSLRSDPTDRAAYAMKLQLEKQLKDAKDELAKQQADNAYNQQLEGLDKQAKNYEDAKNNELEELETNTEAQRKVIQDYLGQVKDNYKTVYNTLTQYGKDYGVKMTDELISPWDSASSAVDTFQSAVSDAMAQINIDIASIDLSKLTDMVSAMNGLSGGGSSGGFEDITGTGTWHKNKTGDWYGASDEDYASDGIYTIGGKQYSFNEDGYMKTGWNDDSGEWRYFEPENGQMVKSSWRKDKEGKEYYLKSDGSMATDMAIKSKSGNEYYYVDDKGVYGGKPISYDEVKKKNITVGYKNGTLRTKDELAYMDEEGVGSELMNKQGTLMQFKNGDAVFDKTKTKNLWEFSNNPNNYVKDMILRNQTNLSSAQTVNRNNSSVNLEINSPLIRVDGNADEKTLLKCGNMITTALKNELPTYLSESYKRSSM